MTGLQAIVAGDVKQDGEEANVINNVLQVIMEEIVGMHVAINVTQSIPIDVTRYRVIVTTAVYQDGQGTYVVSHVSMASMVKIVRANAA